MTTFRDVWILCPHCGARHTEAVMMSTNNGGWKRWSDGYGAGTFHRFKTALRLCRQGHPFLLQDAEELPIERPPPPEPPRRGLWDRLARRPARPQTDAPPEEPPRTIVPSLPQLYAIADGVDAPAMVLEARLFAWWAENEDERAWGRRSGYSTDAQANAAALLPLAALSADPLPLVQAQLLRQFGRHAEAEAVCAAADLPDWVREALIALCREESPRIVELVRPA